MVRHKITHSKKQEILIRKKIVNNSNSINTTKANSICFQCTSISKYINLN